MIYFQNKFLSNGSHLIHVLIIWEQIVVFEGLEKTEEIISSYNNSFLEKRHEILFCFNLGSVQNFLDWTGEP